MIEVVRVEDLSKCSCARRRRHGVEYGIRDEDDQTPSLPSGQYLISDRTRQLERSRDNIHSRTVRTSIEIIIVP